ncbi:MAG TPA: VWA domain-containing protein [Allosphingosinicella sp.]
MLLAPRPATAQETEAPPDEQEQTLPGDSDDASIVVTGTRVRQGGAQDIGHFRSIAADVGMPRPESLTVEGLLGEHDLDLPVAGGCRQLFCLATESMAANLPLRPDDKLFVGLGFASNVDAATWRREPLNLVAVVDKSGSMSGGPLELVRQSLRQIVGQLREGDQLAIVLYGDRSHVHLQPTAVTADRTALLAAIAGIESAGSTNMEEGLQVGYDAAFASAPLFRGNTRLMLFTDEQPNVGRTDAASFMGMAEAASRRDIGLTTIGVGVQFDGALASKVSSARGGNLFFIADEEEVRSVFDKQLDTMVSELAHDVRITLTPRPGFRLSGVFGVPDGLMTEGQDGAVTITVPTAFLSTNGGGIFASLAKARDRENLPAPTLTQGTPLMEVTLSYVGAADGKPGSDRVVVANPSLAPSRPLRLAHLLVDEYLSLRRATESFHRDGKPKEAFAVLSGLNNRISGSGIADLDGEKKLVDDMLAQAALYSGYGGEQPKSIRHLSVVGSWRVKHVLGLEDVRPGDLFSFSADNQLTTVPKGKDEDEGEFERYQINARQLYVPGWNIVFDYGTTGDTLRLVDRKSDAIVQLTRVDAGT